MQARFPRLRVVVTTLKWKVKSMRWWGKSMENPQKAKPAPSGPVNPVFVLKGRIEYPRHPDR